MSRRFVFVVMSVAFVLASTFVFAGGQQQGQATASSSRAAPLQVMIYKDNPGQQVPTEALVKKWAQDNNKKVQISVSDYKVRTTAVTTALEGGTGPDILVLADFEPYQYAKGLLDVTDLANKIAAEDGGWYPISKTIGDVNGTWKALPVYIYSQMLLYRKDLLQKAGVSVPKTWAEFSSALQKLKDAHEGVTPFGISLSRSFDGQQFLTSIILSNGGRVLSPDGSKIAFNSPETVKALSYVIGLYKDGLINQDALSWTDSTNNQAMLSGKLAMTFNSNSIKLQAEKQFPELNPKIGTALVPAGPNGVVSNPATFSFAIRSSTKLPGEAKSLLGYLFENKNYAKVLTDTYGSTGVSLKGFENLPVWSEGDNMTNLAAVPTAHLFAPPSAQASQVSNQYVIINMVADVLNNGMTPQQAVAKAAAQMQQIYFGK